MELKALDSGSGPTALLLHGQPGSAADWAAVAERLRAQMRVVVPDRPGYGRTGGPAMGFRDNAAAMVGLLDRLEVESAVVAGHSWGCGVALALAIEFPQRVEALVLAAPPAPTVPPGPVDRILAHPIFGPAAVRLGFLAAGLGLSLPLMRRPARAAVPALQPGQLAETAAQWRSDRIWKSFYVEQRALVDELPRLAPGSASLRLPVTILTGSHDRLSPPVHAEALAHELPRTELIEVDDAGHLVPQQRPDLVAEAISELA